jgi:hypothetical protein
MATRDSISYTSLEHIGDSEVFACLMLRGEGGHSAQTNGFPSIPDPASQIGHVHLAIGASTQLIFVTRVYR